MGIEAKVASANDSGSASELTAAMAQRKALLIKARGYYERLIDLYSHMPPSDAAGKEREQQSYFHRADCAYELGEFADAVGLYKSAASRYQDKPAALAAYVQIANSYCAMGKMEEAKAANEKAKAFLRSLPADAFSNGSVMIPKTYWEQWLKWTSSAGAF
jgi:tetratricopeptide (TPR) repeat protein